ncbi:MAG: hypothetical protein JWO77_1479 [Ilumatobacteraceae bacterium]|nr:hypothetical protein [Ilumatobacteraceae bacterium]
MRWFALATVAATTFSQALMAQHFHALPVISDITAGLGLAGGRGSRGRSNGPWTGGSAGAVC